jgi:hypothetical protein
METQLQARISHDFWESRLQRTCPLCEGIGFQLFESQGQRVARKCRCISPQRIVSLQRRSGIPPAYWAAGLNGSQAHSLQEASLLDAMKGLSVKRDAPTIFAWIPPSDWFDSTQLLLNFANDLIRLQGYSCLWMDCGVLSSLPSRTNPTNLDFFDPALAKSGDFLFVQNYLADRLKAKLQTWLEEVLRYRLLHQKSTVFVGPRPEGLAGHQSLFSRADLGISMLKKMKDFDLLSDSVLEPQSGWLF